MRLAAIDIGTNSIHTVIAQASGKGGFDILDTEREVVQVGLGSFSNNRLRADAIARTAESLARMVALAKRMGAERILCTATAAVREARNGGDFVRACRAAAGITPRIIPAHEEGRLIHLGVMNALPLPATPSLIVDIGGGSMQLVVGDRQRLIKVVSMPLGALRLSELYPLGDPPRAPKVSALARYVRRTAKADLGLIVHEKPRQAYGSSGSIHALAHAASALLGQAPVTSVNGHMLSTRDLERTTRLLARMTAADRAKIPGVDPARAKLLVHAAVVLLHVLETTKSDGITLSDFGVREGLLADDVARHAQEISHLDSIEDLRLRSVLQLLERFRGDETHARHVADLSLALFDGLQSDHGLSGEDRRLLEFAAILHDVGSVIGHDRHSEHSRYIIVNGGLRGLSAEEIARVSTVARFHGKARPKKSDPVFAELARADRRGVRWMAALLRIAESLDRSQYQLVKGVRVEKAKGVITLRVQASENARLELWAARSRTGLLARLTGNRVRIVTETVKSAGSRAGRGRARPAPARAKRAARRPARSKRARPRAGR